MCTSFHIAMKVCCACSGNKVSQRRAINQSSDWGRGTAAGNKTSTCIVLYKRQCVLLFIMLLECVVPVQTKNFTEGRTQPSSSQQTGVQGQPQVLLSCMGISVCLCSHFCGSIWHDKELGFGVLQSDCQQLCCT